jgi:hypothetical protein
VRYSGQGYPYRIAALSMDLVGNVSTQLKLGSCGRIDQAEVKRVVGNASSD